jgi:hypothetical protein
MPGRQMKVIIFYNEEKDLVSVGSNYGIPFPLPLQFGTLGSVG